MHENRVPAYGVTRSLTFYALIVFCFVRGGTVFGAGFFFTAGKVVHCVLAGAALEGFLG